MSADPEDHVEDVANDIFMWHQVRLILTAASKTIIIPMVRACVAAAGAFLIHWSVLVAFVALAATGVARAYWKAKKGASSLPADRPREDGMSVSEAADKLEEQLMKLTGFPRNPLAWLMFSLTVSLCMAWAWLVSGNGGFMVLIAGLAIVSPWATARVMRKAFRPVLTLMRFSDHTKPRDTPEM